MTVNYPKPSAFPVTNGVKEGCILAQILFSMMFSAIFTDAFRDCRSGIVIRYRFDGKLFSIKRLQAVTKLKETVISDFLFADDCALNASNKQEMQQLRDRFSSVCDSFGLTISIRKAEVTFQATHGNQYHEPQIQVNGQALHEAHTFTYLGSTLSHDATNGCRDQQQNLQSEH